MRPKSAVILTAFVFLSLSISFGERAVAGVRNNDGNEARVMRVNDGDTVTVSINGRRERIRLIGIDAPEMGQGFWGERAKIHLEDILYSSRNVYVEYDVERRDKYGRLLAYIRTTDGRLVNAEMLRDGYAVLFTFPPNVKHVEEFTSAQRRARESKRGIGTKTACRNCRCNTGGRIREALRKVKLFFLFLSRLRPLRPSSFL